jgi:hypothetical protein
MEQNQLNSKKPKNMHNFSFDQFETCWIGNITDKVSNSELEVYFKINAETIRKIHIVSHFLILIGFFYRSIRQS